MKNFTRWRQPEVEFVKLSDTIQKSHLMSLKRELLKIYPELSRQIFDCLDKSLGSSFTYA